MTTTITGLGSGFDIDSWVESLVSAKKSSTVTPLEEKLSTLNTKNSAISSLKSKCSTLLSAVQTFTKTIYNSSSDMWTNTSITSSNSAYATATSTGSVAAASVNLEIEQIATATSAKSTHSIGTTNVDDILNSKFDNLANGLAKTGDFSLFLNGKEYSVDIENDDTLSNVIDKISEATDGKVQASVSDDGIFHINAYKKDDDDNWVIDEDANFSIGSSADESNFAAALKLNEQKGTYGFDSSYAVSGVLTSVAMASEESGIKGIEFYNTSDEESEEGTEGESTEADRGTVTINGVDFTVTKTTSMQDLISQINGNSDANVQASYDSLTNKLILTSSETGKNNISLSEDGTNLLQVLGLTEVGSDGEEILADGSQELGQNAIVYVNGNRVVSNSNTITGESSGISNLSITVKKPTSTYSKDPDDEKNVTLDIESDTTAVKEALNTFVTAYNDVISTIKSDAKSTGSIGSDSTLTNLSSQLRNIVSNVASNDGMYNLLAQIGISTSSSDATNLSINNTTLDEALSENLFSVKTLLSDGYTSKEDNGVFDKLAEKLTAVLDSSTGYFANVTDSIDSQITSLNTRITNANTQLTSYQERITEKFNTMDSTLSSLNTQLSTFSSYFS